LFIVAASIASLKVTVIFALTFTLVAPVAGVNDVTVGGVVSGDAVVKKVKSTEETARLPAASLDLTR
jgi:ABC-type microcin C transport system permease subunit YejE